MPTNPSKRVRQGEARGDLTPFLRSLRGYSTTSEPLSLLSQSSFSNLPIFVSKAISRCCQPHNFQKIHLAPTPLQNWRHNARTIFCQKCHSILRKLGGSRSSLKGMFPSQHLNLGSKAHVPCPFDIASKKAGLGFAAGLGKESGGSLLPAPGSTPWWAVLALSQTATRHEDEAAFKRLARERHPDRPGGSHDMMADLNRVREQGMKERGQ